MDINWKLRFQNKAVLTGLVGAVLLFVKQVTELFGFDLSAQLEQISGIIGAILTLLAGIGVITDPTSKGVSDSGIAKTYDKPRNDKKTPVQYQSESDIPNKLTPLTYDTSEPFTDDSDEIVVDYATGGGSYEDLKEEDRDNTSEKAFVEVE